jgi:glycine dehydrogenase subunit 1
MTPMCVGGSEASETAVALPSRYEQCFLVAVTEKRSRVEIDRWAKVLCEAPSMATV